MDMININAHLNRILFSWPFLLALSVLLLNDFYLKAEYSNGLTGKLSDFSGILLISLILFGLKPRYKLIMSLLICGLFIYWKSAYSDALIQFINHYTPLTYGRVVDYSDLMALSMLPVAYWYVSSKTPTTLSPLHGLLKIPLLLSTSFAIMATSQLAPPQDNFVFNARPEGEKLETEQVVKIIKTVAFENELFCDSCEPDEYHGRFYADGLSFTYAIGKQERTIEFEVIGAHDGFLLGPANTYEEMKVLQEDLKAAIEKQFNDVDFVFKAKQAPF